MKIKFYPVDITYRIIEGKAKIFLFGRTVEGKQITVVDSNFKPYFYVIAKDKIEFVQDKIKSLKLEEKSKEYYVTEIKQEKRKFEGKEVPCLKVFVNVPNAVPKLKYEIKDMQNIDQVLEADILFKRRYLIDKNINMLKETIVEGKTAQYRVKTDTIIEAKQIYQENDDVLNPKVLAIDIETYAETNHVNPEKNPILMVSLYGKDYQKVITWKKFETKHKYIEFVNSEAELIETLKKKIEKYSPDIITGYYSDGFDFPYIIKRADKYKIKLDLGLNFSELKTSRGKNSNVEIPGICHIDILRFIRTTMRGSIKSDNYDLNSIAEELLGEEKTDADVTKLAQAWNQNINLEKFAEYNLQDSLLAHNLLILLYPNIIELIKITNLGLFDVTRLSASQLVEYFLIKKAQSFNELVPNKPNHHEIKERLKHSFKGAFVYKPNPGFYEDIIVCDFRSLYPTIIASHNISGATLRCNCCDEKGSVMPDDENIWFCKKKGFLPTIIEDLIERRIRVKEILKKHKNKEINQEDDLLRAREQSLKLLANSMYGYLGFTMSRWYSLESAKATTSFGRYYINDVISKAEEEGFKVLYGDTDSVFLALKGLSQEKAKNFVEKINHDLPGLMELELEGYFVDGIFVATKDSKGGAKKRYALLDKQGNIKIKGFETVRRDWSLISKEAQMKVLGFILKEKNPKKAFLAVKEIVKDLRNHKITTSKLLMTSQLKKEIEDYENIGPHVAAAKLLKAKGNDVGAGLIVSYIVTKGKGPIRDRVKLPEDVSKEEYDDDYYIKNQVIPAVNRILAVFDYSEEELLQDHKQKGLGDWF